MTLRQIYINMYGEEKWRTLAPRLKGLFERIDAMNVGVKPLSRKELRDALR